MHQTQSDSADRFKAPPPHTDISRSLSAQRARAMAVNEQLGRHLPSLDAAIQENGHFLGETVRAREVQQHLRAMRAEAEAARRQLADLAPAPTLAPSRSPSSSPGP